MEFLLVQRKAREMRNSMFMWQRAASLLFFTAASGYRKPCALWLVDVELYGNERQSVLAVLFVNLSGAIRVTFLVYVVSCYTA